MYSRIQLYSEHEAQYSYTEGILKVYLLFVFKNTLNIHGILTKCILYSDNPS